MRNVFLLLFCLVIVAVSCQKNADLIVHDYTITDSEKAIIASMGFKTDDLKKLDGGFLVEGDIFIRKEDLLNPEIHSLTKVFPDEEHYVRPSLVTGLPRVITIRVAAGLPAKYITSTDAAIARYNALGLQLTFQRVTTGGNIVISGVTSASYLASAGFPSGGNPYSGILVNRSILDTWAANTVTTIIAHEIGHCIGFHHTDYMSTSYSCGGVSPVPLPGPVHVPGTPTGPSADSWMLTCITNGVDRPFTPIDIFALQLIY